MCGFGATFSHGQGRARAASSRKVSQELSFCTRLSEPSPLRCIARRRLFGFHFASLNRPWILSVSATCSFYSIPKNSAQIPLELYLHTSGFHVQRLGRVNNWIYNKDDCKGKENSWHAFSTSVCLPFLFATITACFTVYFGFFRQEIRDNLDNEKKTYSLWMILALG